MRSYSNLRDRTGPLPFVLSPLTTHGIVSERSPVNGWIIAACAVFVIALLAGPMRHGVVDHTHYEVAHVH